MFVFVDEGGREDEEDGDRRRINEISSSVAMGIQLSVQNTTCVIAVSVVVVRVESCGGGFDASVARCNIARTICTSFHSGRYDLEIVLDLTQGDLIRSGCLACMNNSAVVTMLLLLLLCNSSVGWEEEGEEMMEGWTIQDFQMCSWGNESTMQIQIAKWILCGSSSLSSSSSSS